MPDKSNVALKIKKYRKEQNMSQEELSNKSGINISTIKKYESGYRNPKPDQLLKIASALGVSINVFFDFEINTISDVISLLIRLDEQTDMNWSGEKDDSGSYIPDTISFSFTDNKINEALCTYLNYKENTKGVSASEEPDASKETIDYMVNEDDILLEEAKNRLLLFNEQINK